MTSTKPRLVVLLAGQQYVGKTTIAKAITKKLVKLGIDRSVIGQTSLADPIKRAYAKYKGIPLTSVSKHKAAYRGDLQRLGDLFRSFDPDFLLKTAYFASEAPIRIVDDVRYQNEINFFKENSAVVITIEVVADPETRMVRCETIYGPGAFANEDHASETQELTSNFTVVNSFEVQKQLNASLDPAWKAIVSAIHGMHHQAPEPEPTPEPVLDTPAFIEPEAPATPEAEAKPVEYPAEPESPQVLDAPAPAHVPVVEEAPVEATEAQSPAADAPPLPWEQQPVAPPLAETEALDTLYPTEPLPLEPSNI